MIAVQEKYTSVRKVLVFVWLNMVKIQTNDLYRFLLIFFIIFFFYNNIIQKNVK